MDFKILYQKYLANACTPEEKAFVEAEIERAKAVSEEMFKEHTRIELTPAEDQDVLRARKKWNTATFVKTAVISVLSCVVVGCVTIAAVYGISISSANRNMKYDNQQAEQAVKEYIYQHAAANYSIPNASIDTVYVKEEDRDLEMKGPLRKSYYMIEYEAKLPGYSFEVEMNSRTGEITITDVDRY